MKHTLEVNGNGSLVKHNHSSIKISNNMATQLKNKKAAGKQTTRKTSNGNGLKATIKVPTKSKIGESTAYEKTEQPQSNRSLKNKRKPIKDKKEYDKHPVLKFDRSPHRWRDDAIMMDEDEFRVLLKKKLRIIHKESIGWNISEDNETYEKHYESINVIVYGSDGYLMKEPEQQTVYAFYIRYNRYLWTEYSIINAIKIVESIRNGLILSQKKDAEWLKKYKARQKRVKHSK